MTTSSSAAALLSAHPLYDIEENFDTAYLRLLTLIEENMKKGRSPISVKLANISGFRHRRIQLSRMEEKALAEFDAVGHPGSYIQSAQVNP